MAPPMQPQLARRGTPKLHLAYGRYWNGMLATQGYVYVGHQLQTNIRWVRPWNPESILCVTDNSRSVHILDNRCLHAGQRLVEPSDTPERAGQPIVCPYHALSYGQDGSLRRCGRMQVNPASLPEQTLSRREVYSWRGLVFELGQDTGLAKERLERSLSFFDHCLDRRIGGYDLNLERYSVHRTVSEPQTADALTSGINYLDIDHVDDIHRGTLAGFVDMNGYSSVRDPHGGGVFQWMKLNQDWPMSELGRLYQESGLPLPGLGAIWGMTPEGFMLEWYPGVWVVSQCFPDASNLMGCTFHHDFYYHRDLPKSYIDGHQAVFHDTGREDLANCTSTTEYLGRLMALGRGDHEWGFFDPDKENYGRWFYEVADQRIQEFLRRQASFR